jgi:hypothetical protein
LAFKISFDVKHVLVLCRRLLIPQLQVGELRLVLLAPVFYFFVESHLHFRLL